MSSPKVITFSSMPRDDAIAANREGITHYIALARQLYEQTTDVLSEFTRLQTGGGRRESFGSVMDIATAEAKAEALLAQSLQLGEAGESGLEFAHAYWQSLKHPWHENVVRAHARLEAERVEREAEESRRMTEALAGVDASVRIEADVLRVVVAKRPGAVVHDWSRRIDDLVTILRASAAADERDELDRGVRSAASLPFEQQWLAIDGLRIHLEDRRKSRRIEAAFALYQSNRRRLVAERMGRQIEVGQARLDKLASPHSKALQSELIALRERVGADDLGDADEDRLEDFNRRVIAESVRLRLLGDAVDQLRRMGYMQVQVMETVSPGDITSVFLEHAADPEQVALVQVSSKGRKMSAQIQRRTNSTGSSTQRQADHHAQARLCNALAVAEKALTDRWNLKVLSEKKPGEAVEKTKVPLPPRRASQNPTQTNAARTLGD